MACELRMRCGAGRVALLVPPGMSPPAGLTCVLGLFGLFGRQMCEAMVAQIAGEKGYRELLLDPRSYARLAWSRLFSTA